VLKPEPRSTALRIRHPFFRRFQWNPMVVAVPLFYLTYTAYLRGFPAARTASAAFVGLWFGLSVFDAVTGHRWLDLLYSDEDESIEDEGRGSEPGEEGARNSVPYIN
jgi:hypothetical protein